MTRRDIAPWPRLPCSALLRCVQKGSTYRPALSRPLPTVTPRVRLLPATGTSRETLPVPVSRAKKSGKSKRTARNRMSVDAMIYSDHCNAQFFFFSFCLFFSLSLSQGGKAAFAKYSQAFRKRCSPSLASIRATFSTNHRGS